MTLLSIWQHLNLGQSWGMTTSDESSQLEPKHKLQGKIKGERERGRIGQASNRELDENKSISYLTMVSCSIPNNILFCIRA